MHSGDQFTHDVGAACVQVVRWSWVPTRCTGVGIVDIAAVGVAAVPILEPLVGGRGTSGWLRSCPVAAKHSWLLQETAAAVTTAETTSPVVLVVAAGGCALLLYRGIAVG